MKNSKIVLLSFGLLGMVALAGCGSKNKVVNLESQPVITATSTVLNDEYPTVGNDVMKEWKTYRDEKLGVEVQYPAGLKVGTEEDLATGRVIVTKSRTPGSQEKTLFFELSERGTNLQRAAIQGEFLTISEKGCLDQVEAEKIYSDKSNSFSQLKIDGVKAYKIEHADAAAGTKQRTISYFVPRKNGCYVASLILRSTERMNYDEKDRPAEFDPSFYIDTFEKMIARVKFINK